MKIPKYSPHQIIINFGGWQRTIIKVMQDYLNKTGRFGYFYQDDFGYGMCSEESLTRWSK
jgi:hypothetical protein